MRADDAGIKDITDVSLDDLLQTDVDVASKVPTTYREVPGVITVVTREEIMDSGARDLEDVLQLVPGFTPGVDVEGVTDVGVRGNWGHEGKVLLLIDGQQMNETLYSSNQLGNHYPIDQIERIEIIRGPGSAIYGGYAELAVINVVTRGAEELKGVAVYGNTAFNADSFGQANVSIAAGQVLDNGLQFSVAGQFGQGHRSTADYTDFYGDTFNLTDHELNPSYMNFAAKYKELSVRFIYDNYGMTERDGLGANELVKTSERFTGYYGEVLYHYKAKPTLTITPVVNYKRQLPWTILDMASSSFYDKTAERITGGASASWDQSKSVNLLAGAEIYWDHAFLNQPSVPGTTQTQFGTSDSVSYVNEAVYAQGLLRHDIANLTVGARYEHHSQFGSSFVPRAALTRVFGAAHAKVLYSEAFRAPGFENINLAPSPDMPVEPEHTRVVEVEGGYQLDSHNFITVNGFFIRMKQPIVYFINADGSEGYENFSHTGTLGAEADYKLRYKWGYFDANYSYYRAQDNQVPVYTVDGHSELLLGMPAHKVTLHGAWNAWKNLRIAPSLIVTSRPYAWTLPGDGMGVGTLSHADRTLLANVFVSYHDLGTKGLEAGIGVFNLLDRPYNYYQPYDGGHAPMRGGTRQLLLRIGWQKPF